MPSTFGHALAGIAAAWTADLVPGDRRGRTGPATSSWYVRAGDGLTLICVALATLPDADLLFDNHRTFTHSVAAVILVGLLAAAGAAIANRPIARVALMCAGAYGTHVIMDWMAVDLSAPAGLQLLWPFSGRWYLSGWDLFPRTERGNFWSAHSILVNLQTIVTEGVLLLPILVVIYLVREKALARLATELSGRDHPTQ
jgi:membrane-bound metal-dependent hydrolase YbcI (DUF457 family)